VRFQKAHAFSAFLVERFKDHRFAGFSLKLKDAAGGTSDEGTGGSLRDAEDSELFICLPDSRGIIRDGHGVFDAIEEESQIIIIEIKRRFLADDDEIQSHEIQNGLRALKEVEISRACVGGKCKRPGVGVDAFLGGPDVGDVGSPALVSATEHPAGKRQRVVPLLAQIFQRIDDE
jgi:hypothetical protein